MPLWPSGYGVPLVFQYETARSLVQFRVRAVLFLPFFPPLISMSACPVLCGAQWDQNMPRRKDSRQLPSGQAIRSFNTTPARAGARPADRRSRSFYPRRGTATFGRRVFEIGSDSLMGPVLRCFIASFAVCPRLIAGANLLGVLTYGRRRQRKRPTIIYFNEAEMISLENLSSDAPFAAGVEDQD